MWSANLTVHALILGTGNILYITEHVKPSYRRKYVSCQVCTLETESRKTQLEEPLPHQFKVVAATRTVQ